MSIVKTNNLHIEVDEQYFTDMTIEILSNMGLSSYVSDDFINIVVNDVLQIYYNQQANKHIETLLNYFTSAPSICFKKTRKFNTFYGGAKEKSRTPLFFLIMTLFVIISNYFEFDKRPIETDKRPIGFGKTWVKGQTAQEYHYGPNGHCDLRMRHKRLRRRGCIHGGGTSNRKSNRKSLNRSHNKYNISNVNFSIECFKEKLYEIKSYPEAVEIFNFFNIPIEIVNIDYLVPKQKKELNKKIKEIYKLVHSINQNIGRNKGNDTKSALIIFLMFLLYIIL